MAPTHDAGILFDIDGTLIDSTYHHALAWHRAFDRYDGGVAMWKLHRCIGMGGDRLVAQAAGQDKEDRLGDLLRKGWREEYVKIKDEVSALRGATDLIRNLASAGYQVALASSGESDFAKEAVATLNIRDSIVALTTSADAEDSKPAPDLIQVTLEAMDVRRAVLVGDTPYDVQAAERAGLACITVRSGGFGDDELKDAGAALIVDDPQDLEGLDWDQYLRKI